MALFHETFSCCRASLKEKSFRLSSLGGKLMIEQIRRSVTGRDK
jgi:hypothetical protein